MLITTSEFHKGIFGVKEVHAQRLNNCKAWVMPAHYEYPNTGEVVDCLILRSYSTAVAVYFPVNRSLIVLGYYSATTCQHVSKFARLMNPNHTFYLYTRSDHTGYSGLNGRLTTSKVNYLIID